MSGLNELVARGTAIHLMGIGGAGMAGLALLLEARGAKVSGCDREMNEATLELERRGLDVRVGHDAAHLDGHEALVYTAAIPSDQPELVEAWKRGLPAFKRSEALAELVNAGLLVAVAGTHGKTTTTTLTALALQSAGLDPTALVGGRVPAWRGNARIGESTTYVVEADEYDRSFLTLRPRVAVVTSVEAEHLDTYGSPEALEAAFAEFVGSVPAEGRVVACWDDKGARRCLERAGARAIGYGLDEGAALRAEQVVYEPGLTRFSARWNDRRYGEFQLALGGAHNVRNALAALGVMAALEVDTRAANEAFAEFRGVERRFQVLGEAGGIIVVDDYAHHPTEVSATLSAAAQQFGERRKVVAFQPHLYSRTRAFAGEFGRALAAADLVFITAIYAARERPIPGVGAELVVESARAALGEDRVCYTERLEDLRAALRGELRAGDVVITLGAGDIGSVAHALLADLRRSHVDA